MSNGGPRTPSKTTATHELTAESSDKPSNLKATPDRRLRSQRWRSVAELAAEDESSPATPLDPLPWDSLSAIPKTHTADVPDLDWLLELNGLAQTAALPVNAVALDIPPLQVRLLCMSAACTQLGELGRLEQHHDGCLTQMCSHEQLYLPADGP